MPAWPHREIKGEESDLMVNVRLVSQRDPEKGFSPSGTCLIAITERLREGSGTHWWMSDGFHKVNQRKESGPVVDV